MISDAYRSLNELLHRKYPTYGMSGHRWANKILRIHNKHGCQDILDYGCGKGTIKIALYMEAAVAEYDPAVAGKTDLPSPADLVVCVDVLEHVEPHMLDAVLDDLRALSKKVLFATISTKPSKKCLPDGRNAHLIIEGKDWWLDRIQPRWSIEELAENVSQPGEFYIVGVPNGNDQV